MVMKIFSVLCWANWILRLLRTNHVLCGTRINGTKSCWHIQVHWWQWTLQYTLPQGRRCKHPTTFNNIRDSSRAFKATSNLSRASNSFLRQTSSSSQTSVSSNHPVPSQEVGLLDEWSDLLRSLMEPKTDLANFSNILKTKVPAIIQYLKQTEDGIRRLDKKRFQQF